MKPQIKLVRAISSEFVSRKLKAVAAVLSAIAALLLGITLWLTTINAWWWLLAAPIIILTLFGVMAYLSLRVIIKVMRPELTKSQASVIKDFVDKLERVADSLQAPVPLIVFRMIRDIVSPKPKSYVQTVAEDSSTLRKDFMDLTARL